jgi:hypothetical protein
MEFDMTIKNRILNRIEVTTPIEVHDLIDETVVVVDSSTDLTKLGTTELSAIETALDFNDVITMGSVIVDPNPKKSLNKNQNNLNLLGGSCV